MQATYQGASADGSKVFFTTEQELLDHAKTMNLYEYDLRPCESDETPCEPGEAGQLTLLSRMAEPENEDADVQGVLRTSSDGSIVYFVASGKLAGAAPNKVTNEKGEESKKHRSKAQKTCMRMTRITGRR